MHQRGLELRENFRPDQLSPRLVHVDADHDAYVSTQIERNVGTARTQALGSPGASRGSRGETPPPARSRRGPARDQHVHEWSETRERKTEE